MSRADAEISQSARGFIPKFNTLMSAEQNFRNSLHQFRWGQTTLGVVQTDDPQPESDGFSRLYQSISSYVPLRSSER